MPDPPGVALPPAVQRSEADIVRLEEQLLHRVLQRVDFSLEERLSDTVAAAVQQQLDAMAAAFAWRNRSRFACVGDRGDGRRTLGKPRVYANFRRVKLQLNCAPGRVGQSWRVVAWSAARNLRGQERPDHTTGFSISSSMFWRFSCN